LARSILEKEPGVNELETLIDSEILATLNAGTASPQEVREAAAMLKVNKDLERLADLATNIAHKVLTQAANGEAKQLAELQPLAIAAAHMARKTLRALRSEEHTSELQSLAYLVCRLLL